MADAYLAFMGRYSEPLAGLFLEAAGVRGGQTALDVGCGPGALTARLADALGPEDVCRRAGRAAEAVLDRA